MKTDSAKTGATALVAVSILAGLAIPLIWTLGLTSKDPGIEEKKTSRLTSPSDRKDTDTSPDLGNPKVQRHPKGSVETFESDDPEEAPHEFQTALDHLGSDLESYSGRWEVTIDEAQRSVEDDRVLFQSAQLSDFLTLAAVRDEGWTKDLAQVHGVTELIAQWNTKVHQKFCEVSSMCTGSVLEQIRAKNVQLFPSGDAAGRAAQAAASAGDIWNIAPGPGLQNLFVRIPREGNQLLYQERDHLAQLVRQRHIEVIRRLQEPR